MPFCAPEPVTVKGVQESKAQLSHAPHFTEEKIITWSKIRALDPVLTTISIFFIQTLQHGAQATVTERQR